LALVLRITPPAWHQYCFNVENLKSVGKTGSNGGQVIRSLLSASALNANYLENIRLKRRKALRFCVRPPE
jgi:hypothetical protein